MKQARNACQGLLNRAPVALALVAALQLNGADALGAVQNGSVQTLIGKSLAKQSSSAAKESKAGRATASVPKSVKAKSQAKGKSAKGKGTEKKAVAKLAKPQETPSQFVAARVQKVLNELKSRPLRSIAPSGLTVIESRPEKATLLESLYAKNMVEASWATEMLADKRILFEVLEREMGTRATIYFPRTLGVREFLHKHQLVRANGELTSDGDRIEAALFEEFPAGFFVRPAVGVAQAEKGKGLFPDTDQFVIELLKPGSLVYSAGQLFKPLKSEVLGAIASGETMVLQENIIASADARKPLKAKFFNEVRVHTYEGRVVEGAVPERWVQKNLLKTEEVAKAEAFVNDFLKSLPQSLLSRQAWGVDVAVMDNGEMRVIDVVTNRGKNIQWSSYLEQPRVLGAYARHFEKYYGWHFDGISGALIRNNFANYFPYWEKRIEKARPGLGKVMAYLPPIP